MAWAKTKTDLIGTASAKTTIAAGGSSESTSQDVSNAAGILLTLNVTFPATVTADKEVTLEIFSSPDGTNFDSEPLHTAGLITAASTTKQISIPVAMEAKYIKVKVINNDPSYSVDVWVAMIITSF